MLSWIDYASPLAGSDRVLLLMLPPAGAMAAEFETQGLVADAQAGGTPLDIAAVQPDMALYLDGGIARALHRQIVEPARARGYRRIWLLGISLGGMGALLYAASHEAAVEGVILLAPFLGTKGTIAALARSGGIAGGTASGTTTQTERKLLSWLQDRAGSGHHTPKLYLGYGTEDRFAPGHVLLAKLLPPACVVTLPGGHEWPCWRALWQQILATSPFAT
jgi:pimeloyl-ACP methyl ester carboxylesterase